MVATPEVLSHIDDYLWAINAETQFLPELAQGWDAESPENRAIWQSEWAELMVELDLLSELDHAGQLTGAQHTRYRVLVHTIGDAVPLLHSLSLPLPRFALHDLSPSQEP